jgi:LysM repeat protein
MRKIIDSVRSRHLARALLVGTIGVAAAGCSSEVTRFSQPLFGGSSQTQYTGSVTPSPVAGVERRQLDEPNAQQTYPQVASVPPGAGAPTQGGHAAQSTNVVTVQQGDTAHSIARRYGIPHDALMQANGISDPSAVRPGQQLVIPIYSQSTASWQARPPAQQQAQNTAPQTDFTRPSASADQTSAPRPQQTASAQTGGTHRVDHGDTLYSIARAYQVPPNAIVRANNLDSPDRIRVGQTLRIPEGGVSTAQSRPTAQPAVAQESQPQPTQAVVRQQSGTTQDTRTAQAEQSPQVHQTSLTVSSDNEQSAADSRAGLSEPAALSAGNFRWPVRGRVISAFGDSTDGGRNDGVNISVPEGTSVRAAENGVVPSRPARSWIYCQATRPGAAPRVVAHSSASRAAASRSSWSSPKCSA